MFVLLIIVKLKEAQCSLDYLVFGITVTNADRTFVELLKDIPEKNHALYIDLCTNIANSLK